MASPKSSPVLAMDFSSAATEVLRTRNNHNDNDGGDDDDDSNKDTTTTTINATINSNTYAVYESRKCSRNEYTADSNSSDSRAEYDAKKDDNSHNNDSISRSANYRGRRILRGRPSFPHGRYHPHRGARSGSARYGSMSGGNGIVNGIEDRYALSAFDDDDLAVLNDDEEYAQIACRRESITERNPHLKQNGKIGEPIPGFSHKNRILTSDAPRKKYFKRLAHTRSTLHWGQRKLLFSEIEFLTNYGSPEHLILYAGAAPGTHIPFLSELFPDYEFVLVDPSPFHCQESSKITIINDYFADEIAERYKDKNVLFISDIRTADHKDMRFDENERFIEADQLDQMRWVKLLRPHKAMLKFRLPYTAGQTTYLDGDIYLPVWGPQSTTETRLVPFSPVSTRVYDHTQYEEQMFYFNTTTRSSYYEHSIDFDEGEGLDHCFDCTSEIFILREYLKKLGKDHSDQMITAISKRISKHISETRTIKSTPLKINKYIFERRVDQHRAWRTDQQQHKKRRLNG